MTAAAELARHLRAGIEAAGLRWENAGGGPTPGAGGRVPGGRTWHQTPAVPSVVALSARPGEGWPRCG